VYKVPNTIEVAAPEASNLKFWVIPVRMSTSETQLANGGRPILISRVKSSRPEIRGRAELRPRKG